MNPQETTNLIVALTSLLSVVDNSNIEGCDTLAKSIIAKLKSLI